MPNGCLGSRIQFAHRMPGRATHPIARLLGRLALLLRLAGDGPAASSRLASQPSNRTLGRVPLPFLGLLLREILGVPARFPQGLGETHQAQELTAITEAIFAARALRELSDLRIAKLAGVLPAL